MLKSLKSNKATSNLYYILWHQTCVSISLVFSGHCTHYVLLSNKIIVIVQQITNWRVLQASQALTTVAKSCHQQLQTCGQPYVQCKKQILYMSTSNLSNVASTYNTVYWHLTSILHIFKSVWTYFCKFLTSFYKSCILVITAK